MWFVVMFDCHFSLEKQIPKRKVTPRPEDASLSKGRGLNPSGGKEFVSREIFVKPNLCEHLAVSFVNSVRVSCRIHRLACVYNTSLLGISLQISEYKCV